MRSKVCIGFALLGTLAAAPAAAASNEDLVACQQTNDLDKSIAACSRVLEDGSETDQIRAAMYLYRGTARMAKGNLDSALADYDQTVALDPQNIFAYVNRSIAYFRSGDRDRAKNDYRKAVEVNPSQFATMLADSDELKKIMPPAPPLAIAQAALLVAAPKGSTKAETYLGTVVWKLDNVSNGPGQPLATALRADVDIPDDKLQASFLIQKNRDATLPASHTIKIAFAVGAGSPTGGVKDIEVPKMRKADSPLGEILEGLPLPITENVFLVGLSAGAIEQHNVALLRSRAWFDVTMIVSDGRIARLTMEKSTSGQRAFDDAFASWQGEEHFH